MSGAEVEPEAVRIERRRIRGTGKSHCITIIIGADGSVQGDLDDTIALNSIGTESTAESTTIDGQTQSILGQAIQRILLDDFAPKTEPVKVPETTIGESLGLLANTMTAEEAEQMLRKTAAGVADPLGCVLRSVLVLLVDAARAQRDAARKEHALLLNRVEDRNATSACSGEWETCWCDTCRKRRGNK